jgi:glycosyltransferase involved in cell wall biosynthesis
MHNKLLRVIPWGKEVKNAAADAYSNRDKLPTLKIAIVFVDFYRFDSISTSVAEQAIVLDEIGFKVDLICNNFSGITEDLIKPRHTFNPTEYDWILYHYYVGDPMLDQILATKTPKAVYYHGITTPPEVYSPFSPSFVDVCQQGLIHLNALHEFDFVLSSSESNISQLKKHTPLEKANFLYRVLPPVVSLGRFKFSKDVISSSPINLLTVGRVFSSKNIEGVIKFASEVQLLTGLETRLTIAGSKCEPSYVQWLLTESNSNHNLELSISLRASDGRMQKLYQSADIFVSFSHHEGFCIPLLEAMASNVLVVSHSLTAIPETMGGMGIMVAPYDYKNAAIKTVESWSEDGEIAKLTNSQSAYFDAEYSGIVIAGKLIDAIASFLKL